MTIQPQRNLDRAVTSARRRAINHIRKEADYRNRQRGVTAREEIERFRSEASNRKTDSFHRWVKSILSSATDQAVAVLRSTGSSVPVNTSLGSSTDILALTDFQSISVTWPMTMWSNKFDQKIDPSAARQIFGSAKGVLYHEIGHLEHTVPFLDLSDKYNSTPEGMDRPLRSWHHYAWNLLEDQRMEAATIAAVPRKEMYFRFMFLEFLANGGQPNVMYALVSGRAYVPDVIRNAYRQRCVFDVDRIDDIVARYKGATTLIDMAAAVIDMAEIMDEHGTPPTGSSTHRNYIRSFSTDEVEERLSGSSTSDDDDSDGEDVDDNDDDAEGSAGDDSDDAGDDSDDAEGSEDADSEDAEGSAGADSEDVDSDDDAASEGCGSEDGEMSFDQLINKINEEAVNALDEISADNDYKEAIANAYAECDTSRLPKLRTDGMDMSAHSAAACQPVAMGIENALSDFVTAAAPHWATHLDEGVIVPMDFRTRSVGDYDYHTSQVGDSNMALDLHVSFLADASVSMDSPGQDGQTLIQALSRAMYSMAIATRRLNIGSTFVVWSTENTSYRVWDEGEPTPLELPTFGGTDPTAALNDVDSHNDEGASKHLVIVFTDGDLGYDFTFDRWRRDDRTLVLIEYGRHLPSKRYGADYGFAINKVSDLPEKLTTMVSELLARS